MNKYNWRITIKWKITNLNINLSFDELENDFTTIGSKNDRISRWLDAFKNPITKYKNDGSLEKLIESSKYFIGLETDDWIIVNKDIFDSSTKLLSEIYDSFRWNKVHLSVNDDWTIDIFCRTNWANFLIRILSTEKAIFDIYLKNESKEHYTGYLNLNNKKQISSLKSRISNILNSEIIEENTDKNKITSKKEIYFLKEKKAPKFFSTYDFCI